MGQPPDRQTEEARRVLRDILTRRDFVAAGLVVGAGALGLVGCGSGTPTGPGTTPPPPPSPPPGLTQVTGTVSLPSGSGLALNSLSLKVMGQTVALTSAGTFTAGVSPNAPTMALVTDANGNGILAGFLDPTLAGSQPITPRSTGVVLTWFSLGGPFLPATVKSQVLALLTADAAMDTLGGMIAQRIAATPLAIVNTDAQVASALGTALDALTAGLAGAPATTSAGAAHLADPPTLTLTPTADQSGVSVRPDPSIVGVDIANSSRRPVKAYVYETQTSTAGTATDFSPARLVAGPIDIGEPTVYTAVGGIKAFLAQPAPFRPYTLDPIALALDGMSDHTTYEIVFIGPSSKGVVPDFFSAARYATQVPVWNSAIDAMFARTFFCDLTYAMLLEMTGFGSVLPTSPNLVAASASTKQFAGSPFTGTPALPPSNAVFLAKFRDTVTATVNDVNLAEQYRAVAPTIMDRVEALALQQVNKVDWQASLKTASNFVLKLGSPMANYKSNGNLSKLLDDIARADRGVLWTAAVSKSAALITPADPSLSPGEQVALTVVLSPDLTSTYEFDWTQSSTHAVFAAVGQNTGGSSINTLQPTVSLITTLDDNAPIALQVLVFDVANGHKAQVARATSTVELLLKATITPIAPGLAVGEKQTFMVSVSGTLPAGVQYIWTLTGNAGSIGALNLVTTTVPTLQYTAVRKGTDTLKVQVADRNNQLLAKGSATVTVDPDAFIELVVSGTWDPTKAPPNGTYPYTDFLGGRSAPGSGEGTGDPTIDALAFQFDNNPGGVGILFLMFVRAGAPFSAGDTFSLTPLGVVPSPGQFVLLLDTNLSNPADPSSNQVRIQGTGTLTIDTRETLADGSFLADYSFTINNGSGGTVTATGVGTWK